MNLKDLEHKYPHLNLRWSMAQMDQIMDRARRGATADAIAFEFDTTTVEIVRLARRNGFLVKPARMVPRLVPITRGEA